MEWNSTNAREWQHWSPVPDTLSGLRPYPWGYSMNRAAYMRAKFADDEAACDAEVAHYMCEHDASGDSE